MCPPPGHILSRHQRLVLGSPHALPPAAPTLLCAHESSFLPHVMQAAFLTFHSAPSQGGGSSFNYKSIPGIPLGVKGLCSLSPRPVLPPQAASGPWAGSNPLLAQQLACPRGSLSPCPPPQGPRQPRWHPASPEPRRGCRVGEGSSLGRHLGIYLTAQTWRGGGAVRGTRFSQGGCRAAAAWI